MLQSSLVRLALTGLGVGEQQTERMALVAHVTVAVAAAVVAAVACIAWAGARSSVVRGVQMSNTAADVQ